MEEVITLVRLYKRVKTKSKNNSSNRKKGNGILSYERISRVAEGKGEIKERGDEYKAEKKETKKNNR